MVCLSEQSAVCASEMSPTQTRWSQDRLGLALQIIVNLCVKKVKRCDHGFRTFEHYRLRVLLHAGGVIWPSRPRPPRIGTAAPYSDA